MAAPTMPPPVKLSSAALAGIIVILALMAAGIFAYILILSGLTVDQRLWWAGFVSIAFAFAAFLAYAGTEGKPLRTLAGGLFLVGAASYYGSIFANPGTDQLAKLIWSVLLSIIVVIVLAGVYTMSRQAEETKARVSRRRLTP